MSEQDAILICARLLREGFILKTEFPQLEFDDELVADIRRRLQSTGTDLVTTVQSPYYAVRFQPEIQQDWDESNNLGLRSNEIAMLVILWSKLILPKRAMSEGKINNALDKLQETVEEQDSSQNKDITSEEEQIYVKITELWAEFGENFGSKTTFRAILSRLNNLQFIRLHNEVVTEGNFLDLLINSQEMAKEIKRSALAYKLAGIGTDEEEDLESE